MLIPMKLSEDKHVDWMESSDYFYHLSARRRGGLVVERRTPEREDRGFDTHSGRHVVSLSKIYLPKSTGNTQEAVAPSRHD